MFMAPDVVINGEFFKDPPLQATEQRREQLTGDSIISEDENSKQRPPKRSTILSQLHCGGCQGEVASTRLRYEDSTGRLKVVHERQTEGKKLPYDLKSPEQRR
ncbi:hypothetical protein PC128_g19056 [Phytophthora cactorum]|nr:hypothetical protein PC128_g19056 [Phytophthora cactorum]